jgi:putative ABC transport system ATP-binding protein
MGHPLFEQFSVLSADELPEYEAILARRSATVASAEAHHHSWLTRTRRRWLGLERYSRADAARLIALPLAYIEPRHRLGLLNDDLREAIVAARAALHEALDAAGEGGVDFYEPDSVCLAAPLRDNLLFGRINHSSADAARLVTAAITATIAAMDLTDAVARVGLDHQVGPSGRFLSGGQRASVSLVRALVRQPDLLVLDGALSPMGETRARAVLDLLLDRFGRTASLVVVLPNERVAHLFDSVLEAKGTSFVQPAAGDADATPARQVAAAGDEAHLDR